jgi:hypothetical protein
LKMASQPIGKRFPAMKAVAGMLRRCNPNY